LLVGCDGGIMSLLIEEKIGYIKKTFR